MLLRRFTTEELAAELSARGFEIFPKGAEDGIVRVSISRPAHYVDAVGPDERKVFERHWNTQVVNQIGIALMDGGAIAFSQHREGPAVVFVGEVMTKRLPPKPEPNADIAPLPVPAVSVDPRPTNCRNRLEDEGKAHPRSGCQVSGCLGVFAPSCREPRSARSNP